MPKFEPTKALEAIQKHKVTIFCGVPTMYSALLSQPRTWQIRLNLNSRLHFWRFLFAAANAKTIHANYRRIPRRRLWFNRSVTSYPLQPRDSTMKTVKVGSIGLPLPDTDARIVDLETGEKTLGVGRDGRVGGERTASYEGLLAQTRGNRLSAS